MRWSCRAVASCSCRMVSYKGDSSNKVASVLRCSSEVTLHHHFGNFIRLDHGREAEAMWFGLSRVSLICCWCSGGILTGCVRG